MRTLFDSGSKQYYISGAPQYVLSQVPSNSVQMRLP